MRRDHPVPQAVLVFALAFLLACGGMPVQALAEAINEVGVIDTAAPDADGWVETGDPAPTTADPAIADPLRIDEAPSEDVSDAADGESIDTVDASIEEPLDEEPTIEQSPAEELLAQDSAEQDQIEEFAAEAQVTDGSTIEEVEAEKKTKDREAALSTQSDSAGQTSLAKARVATISKQPYTGNAIKPTPTVMLGSRTLTRNVDYTFSYANNTKVGTATITVKGKGNYTGSTKRTFQIVAPTVQYRVHRQTYGWETGWKSDGQASGTMGKSKRLEGIYIKLGKGFPVSGGIEYRTHIQSYGWEKSWKSAGQMSGTTGESKRLEAIQIRLTGAMKSRYDVYYRVHAQRAGWMGWAKNGAKAGTQGFSFRLEAIQIVLVPKGKAAPSTSLGGYKRNNSHAFLKYTPKSYPSLASVGITYGSAVNAKVDATLKNLAQWCALQGTDFNAGLSSLLKARWILHYVGTHYQYGFDSYTAESMIDNGYGTCFAFSDLVLCLARKVGISNSWLCVPGRPRDHVAAVSGAYISYGSQHRTVVARIGDKYYDLDGNGAIYGSYDPEPISNSYALYLLGKRDSFTSFV